MPNRLANETSPYLLQHKDNPVDWYPWGPEALARAKELGRPMLVSIGYSACHWCHVMEHESFEDPDVAEEMNAKFINIKVDREERPDLDNLFMTAVQALSGQGGWPLNVFLTPSGVPFYGGTYFPPEDRSGIPAWGKIIDAVSEAYTTKRDEVEESAEQIADFLRRSNGADPDRELLSHTLFDAVLENFAAGFDPEHGGFGRAPKFPQASLLVALLRIWHRTKSPVAGKLLTKTLTSMARGGIYDHVGGGFHRYAVDEKWLVPHFEKMLYDNAQLASIYLAAYQAFGDPLYARVATETLDWIVREMTGPQGQFYAAQDADSEGEEGRFYVWTVEEIRAATGAVSPTVERYFAVEPGGNFEGRSILHVPVAPADVATSLGVTPEELQATIDQAISDLYSAREEREHPGRDDKSLAGWNGMALRAFAEGARILDRPDYLAVAVANAEFLLTTQRSRGRLYRTYKDGQAKVPAFLEDFANVIDGLLSLYQATLDERWLTEALDLADVMVAAFGNPNGPGFFDTSASAEQLVARPRDWQDGALPCGSSVAADVLMRIGAMTGNPVLTDRAVGVLESVAGMMKDMPFGFGRYVAALDFHLSGAQELVLSGDLASPQAREMLDLVWSEYRPNLLLGKASADAALAERVQMLADRPARGTGVTAYLCEQFHCLPPVSSTEDLAELLSRNAGMAWSEI